MTPRGTFWRDEHGTKTDLAGWGAQDTVIISRKPLSDADVAPPVRRLRRPTCPRCTSRATLRGTSSDSCSWPKIPWNIERNYQFDITPVIG